LEGREKYCCHSLEYAVFDLGVIRREDKKMSSNQKDGEIQWLETGFYIYTIIKTITTVLGKFEQEYLSDYKIELIHCPYCGADLKKKVK
jgi:hypothetical protein